MAKKEKCSPRVFDRLKEAVKTDSSSIDGAIACVSPMKTGKGAPFFDANLTGGAVQMRVVGFQGSPCRGNQPKR